MLKNLSILISIFIIFCFTANAQLEEESKLNFNDGINRSSIEINTTISDKFSMRNALIFSNYYEFSQIEIPLFIEYNINDKWSLFTGPQLNYFKSSNTYLKDSEFSTSIQAGVRYQFNQNVFGELKYEYNLLKNNSSVYNAFKKGAVKFNFEYQF